MIQFSGHYGDAMARNVIFPLQDELNILFTDFCAEKHLGSIERLTVIFRISGDARDFGGDGPERLRYIKTENELTADLVIPAKKWKSVSEECLRNHIEENLETIFSWMMKKAKSIQNTIDTKPLETKIDLALQKFCRK